MRQELERALEAIESACKRIDELKAENKTLKEALAQPEQEPVALQYSQKDIDWQQEQQIKAQASTPPQSTDEEEYLSKAYRLANELRCHLAIAPAPQRTWVGLTDEDRAEILNRKWWNFEDEFDVDGFLRLAEDKLKEKNNG